VHTHVCAHLIFVAYIVPIPRLVRVKLMHHFVTVIDSFWAMQKLFSGAQAT